MYLGPWLVTRGVVIGIVILVIFSSMITTGLSFPSTSAASGGAQLGVSPSGQDNTGTKNEEEISVPQGCQVNDRYPESVLQWCDLITLYAVKFELSPDLVAALIWQESGGKPRAYSKSGAVGLMQVMPRDGVAASFMCKNGPCFSKRPTTNELQDPEFNIKYGTKMLSRLLNDRGNLREALKSYGPKDVGYYYADKVLGIYTEYGG